MYRFIERQIRASIARIRSEAARRKEVTPSDPAIEALEWSANQQEASLNDAMRDTEQLTPEQYAELHHCTPQSVRRWIRVGELEAQVAPSGYLIARDARRVLRKTG